MNNKKIIVEFENLTEAQAITLEAMFALWSRLGRMGSSRWTAFMADGDGNFRPKIKVNGNDAKESDLVSLNDCIEPIKRIIKYNGDSQLLDEAKWVNETEVYFIDYDKIAWKLRNPK